MSFSPISWSSPSRIARSTSRPNRLRAGAVIALALLAASCGDGGAAEEADLPTLGGDAEAAAGDEGTADSGQGGASPGPSEAEMSRVLEQWRECMLEALPAGSVVDVSITDGLPDISISIESGDDGDEDQAHEQCDPLLADLERSFIGSPEDIAARRDQSAKAIDCLADRGFSNDIEGLQLTVDETTGYFGVDITGDGIDESAFAEAEAECLAEAGLD